MSVITGVGYDDAGVYHGLTVLDSGWSELTDGLIVPAINLAGTTFSTLGNLTASSPLSLSATRQVIGGAAVVSIADAAADGATKGAAAFSSTNFSAAAGVVNTIQNIHSAATPTFAGLIVPWVKESGAAGLGLYESGGAKGILIAHTTGYVQVTDRLGVGQAPAADKAEILGAIRLLGTGAGGTGSFAALDYDPTTGNSMWLLQGKDASTRGTFLIYAMESDAGNAVTVLCSSIAGYVGIGTPSPQVLCDIGTTAVAVDITTTQYGLAILGRSGGNYACLDMGMLSSINAAWLQPRNRGTTAMYDLALCPLGGKVGINTGLVAPARHLTISHATDPTLGLYHGATEAVVLRAQSGPVFQVDVAGNAEVRVGANYLGIGGKAGGSNRDVTLYLATDAHFFWNEAESRLYCTIGGASAWGATVTTFEPISGTTATAANVYQAGSGTALLRYSSSARYKRDVESIAGAGRILDGLRPVTFRSLCKADDPERRYFGLIAEEVHALGYPGLVNYVEQDGKTVPDGVQYTSIVPLLVGGWQDHEERLKKLEEAN